MTPRDQSISYMDLLRAHSALENRLQADRDLRADLIEHGELEMSAQILPVIEGIKRTLGRFEEAIDAA